MTLHFTKAATNFAAYKQQFNFSVVLPSRLCGIWALICDLQVFGIQVQCTTLIVSFQWGLSVRYPGAQVILWLRIKVVMCYTVILVYLIARALL